MYNMKIGISTASFFPNLYTEEAVSEIAKLGGDVCEVFFASRCEYTADFADVILQNIKKASDFANLQVHSVHALTNQFEPEIFSLNSRAFEDAVATFESVCNVAQIIGAKNYTFHGATMLKKAVKYSFNFEHIAKRVNYICDIAKKYGITLCYENVHWAYFCTPEYFTTLKPMCPTLGATLDIKQAMQSDIDWRLYLDAVKDRLKTVHLCDFDDNGNLAIPGQGSFDFVTFFKALKDCGFNGPCLMEVYTKSYQNKDQLKHAFEFLKECEIKA